MILLEGIKTKTIEMCIFNLNTFKKYLFVGDPKLNVELEKSDPWKKNHRFQQ